MERKDVLIQPKRVVYATQYRDSLQEVLTYAIRTWGITTAKHLDDKIEKSTKLLPYFYESFVENRYLATKSQRYRNIIIHPFVILYRIEPTRVRVLMIYHSSRSPRYIKQLRNIK